MQVIYWKYCLLSKLSNLIEAFAHSKLARHDKHDKKFSLCTVYSLMAMCHLISSPIWFEGRPYFLEKKTGSTQSILSLTTAVLIQTIKSRYIFTLDTYTCFSFKDWRNPHALHLITWLIPSTPSLRNIIKPHEIETDEQTYGALQVNSNYYRVVCNSLWSKNI